jgi:hypothetical protein
VEGHAYVRVTLDELNLAVLLAGQHSTTFCLRRADGRARRVRGRVIRARSWASSVPLAKSLPVQEKPIVLLPLFMNKPYAAKNNYPSKPSVKGNGN